MLTKAELENDIKRYNELLLRSEELEGDIPPRRETNKTKKPRRKQIKEPVKAKTQPVKVKDEPKRTRRQPLRRTKAALRLEDEEEGTHLETEPPRKRPRARMDPKVPTVGSKRIKYYLKHKPVKKEETESNYLRLKIRSFEDHILVTLSYSELVQKVKEDEGRSLDFGMQMNLLPKNLAYERKRFEFEPKSEFDVLLDRRSSFNDDIDRFFRLLSENKPQTAPPDVPLV